MAQEADRFDQEAAKRRAEHADAVAIRDRLDEAAHVAIGSPYSPAEQEVLLGLRPPDPAQDPAEQEVTPQWQDLHARAILATGQRLPETAAAAEHVAAQADADGDQWVIAHGMVSGRGQGTAVTPEDYGGRENPEWLRLVALGAVKPAPRDQPSPATSTWSAPPQAPAAPDATGAGDTEHLSEETPPPPPPSDAATELPAAG